MTSAKDETCVNQALLLTIYTYRLLETKQIKKIKKKLNNSHRIVCEYRAKNHQKFSKLFIFFNNHIGITLHSSLFTRFHTSPIFFPFIYIPLNLFIHIYISSQTAGIFFKGQKCQRKSKRRKKFSKEHTKEM